MSVTVRFQRLVLELGHGAADRGTLRQVAAVARLLDAELHALFVEDETLLHASGLPFAREISPISMRWRKMVPAQLEAEMRADADLARRLLMEAAQASSVPHHFEIRRGEVSLRVGEICVSSDIIVVSAPNRMGAETMHGFRLLRETARHSAASVLFLPPAARRAHGPVVAVVTGDGDPTLTIAEQIAARGKERLLVLTVGDTIPGSSVRDMEAGLGAARESLIVVTRDGMLEGAHLATARGVPVLVVEPV